MQSKPISDIAFNQYLSEEKLMGSKCQNCGSLFVPPRPICISCRDSDVEWVEISGLVELEEGARVDARIENVDPSAPETIKVGMPVKVKFLHRETDVAKRTFLAFEKV